jgi:prevent-host-death family protein
MRTFNIHEAKTNLSKLIEMAVNGEPFIIAKAGKPMVQVSAISEAKNEWFRKPGFLKGKVTAPKDIKAFAREEIEEMFYGNPDKLKMGKRKK